MMNYDVFYLTGLDEHGQKIQQKAEEEESHHKSMDGMAVGVKDPLATFDISYDKFIRTTDDYHEKVVAQVFERPWNKEISTLVNTQMVFSFQMKNFSLKVSYSLP